jgi:hypothetical protein
MRRKNLHKVLFAFFSFLLLLHALLFWRAKEDAFRGLADFSSFYTAAWMVRQGLGYRLYDLGTQIRAQEVLYPNTRSKNDLLPYIHPPFEALLYLPLTYVSYRVAYAIWVIVNIFVLLAAAMLLEPHMTELKAVWAPLPLLLFLGFFPVFIGILQGQDSVLLLLIFSLVYVCLKTKRDFSAGTVLALGLFKFQYTVPFLVPFLLWRRWKVLGGVASSIVVLFLLSLPVAGFYGTMSYSGFLLNLVRGSTSYHSLIALGMGSNTMPNIRGAVETLGTGLLQPGYQKVVVVLLSGASIVWAAIKWHISRIRPEKAFDLGFALALVTSILVSYHLQLHDLTLLLIPFILFLDYSLKIQDDAESRQFLLFGIIALFYFSPLYLWLIQRNELYLLFFPILFLAAMLSHEIGPSAREDKNRAEPGF